MTLRNLSDKEIKTINGGDSCFYECGIPFYLTCALLNTLENAKDIYNRFKDLIPKTSIFKP